MEQILNSIKDEFKDQNIEMTIECGWKEKVRRKEIIESFDTLIKANEIRKLDIAKKLTHNYLVLDKLMDYLEDIPYYKEYEKSDPRGVYEHMDMKLDFFKECLKGSIVALAKDEELEDFYKKLMGWKKDEEEDEEGGK